MRKFSHMKKEKKGMSELVSWVLLIGFVVAIGGLVTVWMKATTEETTAGVTDVLENDIRCADVSLNVRLDCSLSPPAVSLANRGKFTINAILIRQPNYEDNGKNLNIRGLEPGKEGTETLKSSFDTAQPVDFLPLIDVDGRGVLCSERKVVVTC